MKADELLFEHVRGALLGVGGSKYGGMSTVLERREQEAQSAFYIPQAPNA
jgi:hypothetical protein